MIFLPWCALVLARNQPPLPFPAYGCSVPTGGVLFAVSLEFTLSLEFADGLVWSRKHGQQGQVDTSVSPLLRCL